MLYEQGATPVVADALDPDQVAEAVGKAKPDVIIHELTAIPDPLDMRHFDRDFALTNRLRTEGTDHLLSAGQAVGIKRFIAQSYAAWPYERVGGPVKNEADPLDPSPAREMRQSMQAIRHLEKASARCQLDGGHRAALRRVLRSRHEHDCGQCADEDWSAGASSRGRRRRRGVVVIHVADAAEATVAALDHGTPGVYNVVDDDPARSRSGCRRWHRRSAPRSRCACHGSSTAVRRRGRRGDDDRARGASNDKAKRELRSDPAHPAGGGREDVRRCRLQVGV